MGIWVWKPSFERGAIVRVESRAWRSVSRWVMLVLALVSGDGWSGDSPARAGGCDGIVALPVVDSRSRYALFDVLAFQRDNEAAARSLVNDSVTGDTLLATGDLAAATAIGGRLFVGERSTDGWGREAGYFGVYGMTAADRLAGDANLVMAGPISSQILPFGDGDSVRSTWVSTINSAEFNAFLTRINGDSFFDLLAGFRYLSLEEQAAMTFTCCSTGPTPPLTSSYAVQSSNNLFGGQIGTRGRRSWDRWAVEGWAKAGVFGNVESQSQGALVDPSGVGTVVRTARGSRATETAFVGDINASLIYRLTSVWGIRAGYNLIWIDGVALAPDQWDFGTQTNAGTSLVGGGGVFLSGANLGLEARW